MALTVAAAPERISEDAEPIPSLVDADIAAAAAAAADCRVEEVMVFGSVARGEARHGSDIDLLVLTADCAPADLRKIECTLPTVAWEATGLPVDVVVERRVAFEYLSRNVTASFEYAVAADLVPLWQAMPLPELSGNLDGVPRNNLDVAATDAQGSTLALDQLATLIGGIPRQEARISNDPSYTKRLSATHRRINRNIGLLENAYQSIERSAAAIRASVDAQRVGKHELDLFVSGSDAAELAELADMIAPLRDTDGKFTSWRSASYAGHSDLWRALASAENASAHISAAVECARLAAKTMRSHGATGAHLETAEVLAEAADEIEAQATDPVSLTTGPAQPPVSDPDETEASDPGSPVAADGDAYDAVGHLRKTNPAAFAGGDPDKADPLADAVQAAAASTPRPSATLKVGIIAALKADKHLTYQQAANRLGTKVEYVREVASDAGLTR